MIWKTTLPLMVAKASLFLKNKGNVQHLPFSKLLIILLVFFACSFTTSTVKAQEVFTPDGDYNAGEYAGEVVKNIGGSGSTCNLIEVHYVIKNDDNGPYLLLGFYNANGGNALFRYYLDTDPDLDLVSDSYGTFPGADVVLQINANGSSPLVYKWNGDAESLDEIDSGDSGLLATSGNFNPGDAQFIEFKIPLIGAGSVINICDLAEGGLINLGSYVSFSGGSINSKICLRGDIGLDINVTGTISGGKSYCSGSANYTTLNLTGNYGAVKKWQKNEGSGWFDLPNTANTNTYVASNVSVTTNYRAIIVNNTCPDDEVETGIATITINTVPEAPTFIVDQANCGETTGSVTITNYEDSQTYTLTNTLNNGTLSLTAETTTGIAPGTYTLNASNGDCDTEAESNVVVNDYPIVPAAPTGEVTQDFCAIDNPTVSDLSAKGTNIKWYAEQGDENALDATTALLDKEDYFATQTVHGCESDEYLQVTVDISDPAAPTGDAVQTFCFDSGATVADLSPKGNDIIWYITEATDTPLLSTETLSDAEDYYASQIVNGCESNERLMVVVEILPEITLSAETTSVTCNGKADGEITVTTDTNVTFEIFKGMENVTSQNGSLSAGFYTVLGSLTSTQTDVICTNEIVVEIKVLDNIDPEITVPESLTLEICTPEEITAENARFPLNTDGSENIKESFEAAGYSASDDQELASLTYTDDIQDNGDCFPLIIRTFYATDNCGGQSSDSITINLEDTAAPEFDQETLPTEELTAECDNIPAAATLTATDDCAGALEVTYTEEFTGQDDECANEYTIIRTWFAEDCAGNELEYVQTITVEDTAAPEFDQETLPTEELTAECDNIPAAATLTATDDCAGALEVTYTEEFTGQDDECANQYTIIRTWFAEDCAGNELEYVQTITVKDTTAPEFDQETLPTAEITAECDNIPAAATLTATDDCAGALEVTYTEEFTGQDDECANEYTIIRTWFAEDCAGNELEYVQSITVEDTAAPEFDQETLPTAEITAECDNIPAAATLTATDDCAGALEVTYTEEFTGQDDECANQYTIIRTWFAEDCAGNELEYVQTITVEDTTAPEFDQETLPIAELTAHCDNIPAAATLTATDDCAGALEVTYTEEFTGQDDECANEYTIIRTWFAEDCAGNELEYVQTITVEDTTAPEFDQETLPTAEITAECDNIPAAATLTATDDCAGALEVTYTEEFTGQDDECANQYTIIRTWFAEDCAGNELEYVQTITVKDTTAPEFNEAIPADMTMECENLPEVPTITATDNCAENVEVEFSEISTKENETDKEYTVTRTWTAADCAGNEISESQVITIQNTGAPSFNENLPADVTVECDAIPNAPLLTASDNCISQIEVIYTEEISGVDDACANEYVITRTWTARDDANNEVSHIQTITVEDTVAPEFDQETLPTAEITAECDNIPAAATLTATDDCAGALEVTYTEEFTGQDDECANQYTIIRTWFAEDCAGNELEYVQTITVEDTTAPEFDQETLPTAEITAECDNIPAAATLTATDDCAGALEVTYTEEFTGQDDECANEYTIIRTWFAEDCAGNELEYVQTITVKDTTAPEFDQETLPIAELTAHCDNIPAAATLTATDDCAGALEVTYTEEFTGQDDECANEYTIIRTWFAEDCAGNELEYVQTITVEDTVAPEFNEAIPADMNMECENLPEIPTITATDNCAENVEVEFSEISTKENETDKEYTVTRTWSAADCAGNEISGSQVITIQNTGAPSFNENLPADVTVECDAVPTAPVITATDGCVGDIEVNYTETFSGLDDECANEYMITRIWTATDDAENEVSHTQTITVVDTTAPEFDQELPKINLTVECDAVPVVVTLTASDNCSGAVEVSFEELISDKDSDDDNNYKITRSYMAADCAGNEVSFTQIITVEDTTAPVITTCPEAVTISSDFGLCSASNVELGMPTATDNCDVDLTITNDAPEVFPIGETTVNWTVTDKAGNIASCSQIVNVVDNENPVVEAIDDININSDPEICGAIVNFETIIATDNCEIKTIEVTEGLSSGSEFPVGTTTVSITVTDMSGNTTTTSFDVNVTDTQSPEITCPTNITVDTETGVSYATVDFDNATATDNCNVTVEQTAGPVSGSQFEIGTTTITFTATDDAGNTSECSFTVIVEDNEDPTITCPADINLNNDPGVCGATVEFTIPEFSDNSGFATIEQTAGLEPGEVFPVGTTTVSYMVTDEAGNSANCSFDVTVTDTEVPVLEEMNDITMNNDNGVCGAVIEFGSVAATDNCEIESVVITEGFESGSEFPVGTTTVTYTVTDVNGNVSTESFTVTVIDNEAPEISCPSNVTVDTETGVSYATVNFENATATDNCEVTVEQTAGPVSGSQFEIGTTTVTFTATDAAGNTTECSFTVTVEDNEDPTISCPSDISQNVNAGICGAAVTFETPEGLDNSGNVTIEQTTGLESGEVFPVGTTTVTFTATDAAGNSVDCSFTVTVADDEAPVIEDMDNITLNTEDGICGAVANFNTPGATDNCEIDSVLLTEGLEPGSVFPVGATTVIYTATDNNGNTATSSFTVTVNDNEAPAIECPESITVNVDNGVTGVVVNYDAVTTTDNCEGTTVELTSGIASGEEFPVGTTTVTYTVTDASGNSTTCSFTVIVNENNPAPPAGPTVEVTPATCSEPTGTITVDVQEGLSYSIDGENYQTEGIFADLAPGTYDVVGQDEFGQLSELTTVSLEDPVFEEIELVNNGLIDLCTEDSTFDLFELFTGEFNDTGVWVDINNTGALDNGFVDPSLLDVGSYSFEYQIAGNCSSTTQVSVLINDDCVVLDCSIEDIKNGISKAVTPNGDNKNDIFKVDLDLACGFTYNVKIFNRWGAKVFDAQNYQNNWDGYSDSSFSSSNQLPSGTYFYILEIREGSFEPIQGYIYLGTK